MTASETYLFSGGGSGGHLFPGIAVSQELRRRLPQARIVFVGSSRAIESSIAAQHGLEHQMLPVESLSVLRRNPLQFVWKNWQAYRAADRLIESLRPKAVIGLGGFASAPVVWAAKRHRKPVVLLEQNVIPGRTTRWLCRYADLVCVSFAETIVKLRRSPVVVTGNPVRDEIAVFHNEPNLVSRDGVNSSSRYQLLILGGSQGADSLNEAVTAAVRQSKELLCKWDIVHQTGPRKLEQVREIYRELGLNATVEPFFADMPARYSKANLVISRAGATTLAELACVGLPSILLPYPHAANDHQRENARVFVTRNAALMVEHTSSPNGAAQQLADSMRQLISDADRRLQMGVAAKAFGHPDAAKTIVDQILRIVSKT